tara:strand:+ start:707 stop:1489 length:783 start_codon:yes stop_codon:yes gene_type:complete
MTIREAIENALPWVYVKVTYSTDIDKEERTVVHCTLNRLLVAENLLTDGKLFDDGSKKYKLTGDKIWVWDIRNKDYIVLDCAEDKIDEFEFMFLPSEVGPNYFTNPQTDTESKEVFEYLKDVCDYIPQCCNHFSTLKPNLTNVEKIEHFLESHNRKTYEIMDLKWSEVYEPTDEVMKRARSNWKNAIISAKDDAIKYLDNEIDAIVEADGPVEEIEAVQDIKKLLNALPSELDLNIHTTPQELGKFWPPLLLPPPDFVIK